MHQYKRGFYLDGQAFESRRRNQQKEKASSPSLSKKIKDFYNDEKRETSYQWGRAMGSPFFLTKSLLTSYQNDNYLTTSEAFFNSLKAPFHTLIHLVKDIARAGFFLVSIVPSLLISPSAIPHFIAHALVNLVSAVLDVVNLVLSVVSLVTRSLATLASGAMTAAVCILDFALHKLGLVTPRNQERQEFQDFGQYNGQDWGSFNFDDSSDDDNSNDDLQRSFGT